MNVGRRMLRVKPPYGRRDKLKRKLKVNMQVTGVSDGEDGVR